MAGPKSKPVHPVRGRTPARRELEDAAAALRPALIRAQLADWRRDLLASGRDSAARRLTALIADFDYLSRGLSRG